MSYIPPAVAVKSGYVRAGRVDHKEQPLNSTFTLHLTDQQLDRTNTLVAAETLIMNEPHVADFFLSGKPAGVVEDISILEGWILHIDDLIEKVENEPGVEVDEFDLAALWLRKSTILCTMGNFDEAKECADKAIDIHESPLGFFRLGIVLYCLGEFDRALSMMLQANEEDAGNVHIEHGLQVVLARMRSRKDRPEIKNYVDDFFASTFE